jgi:hypothetical protein
LVLNLGSNTFESRDLVLIVPSQSLKTHLIAGDARETLVSSALASGPTANENLPISIYHPTKFISLYRRLRDIHFVGPSAIASAAKGVLAPYLPSTFVRQQRRPSSFLKTRQLPSFSSPLNLLHCDSYYINRPTPPVTLRHSDCQPHLH